MYRNISDLNEKQKKQTVSQVVTPDVNSLGRLLLIKSIDT